MIYFFRKIRKHLVFANKSAQYLKYAIGEIFLVVIGILVALQLDNWNDQRKFNKALLTIQQRVIKDIDHDINTLRARVYFIERQQPIYNMVSNDAVTEALIKKGYPYLLRPMPYTTFNTSGIQQLKNLKLNDSHSQKIINLYDRMTNSLILPLEQEYNLKINKINTSFTQHAWFPYWNGTYYNYDSLTQKEQNQDSEAVTAFFMSDFIFKNHIILHRYQLFTVYIPTLKNAITELEAIKSELIFKLGRHAVDPTIGNLNKYVGVYKIESMNGSAMDFEINDKIAIHNLNGSILLTAKNDTFCIVYQKAGNTFADINSNREVELSFTSDDSREISGASFNIKLNNEETNLTLIRTDSKTDLGNVLSH
jgi:hypothetical protein